MTEHRGDGSGRSRNRGRGRRRRGGGGGGRGGGGGHGGGRAPQRVVRNIPEGEPTVEATGVLQIAEAGHGHLRSIQLSYIPDENDVVVPRELIEKAGLETGLELEGLAVPADRPGGVACLARITRINGDEQDVWGEHAPFKVLVAEDPTERIRLEVSGDELSTRVVDIIAPIGKGQRCLIVAPPKAGKTVLLQKLAHSISENHPEIHLIVLLVDERPEEVTDWRRNVRGWFGCGYELPRSTASRAAPR